LHAVAWLAATARNFDDPLRPGQVILSGALGPMAAVGPGSLVYAEITVAERLLGSASARFDTAEEQS
jgi:2-keto-4-pentenoate hydratase